MVLLGLVGFYWVLLVLLGFTGFYRVLLGFTGFYWVLLGFTGFYWVSLGLTGFHWVSLGFTGFYWVLLGFTGYQVDLFTELLARFYGLFCFLARGFGPGEIIGKNSRGARLVASVMDRRSFVRPAIDRRPDHLPAAQRLLVQYRRGAVPRARPKTKKNNPQKKTTQKIQLFPSIFHFNLPSAPLTKKKPKQYTPNT